MDLEIFEIETAVMRELANSLAKLQGQPASQKRALTWLCESFNFVPGASVSQPPSSNLATPTTQSPDYSSSEIPGIAMVTPDNEFVLTLRDVKAASQLDASRRLVHIGILAYTRLFKSADMPSKLMVSILKDWRVYDGNSRRMMANLQGLVRTKDGGLALDAHAKRDAEAYVEDALNSDLRGTWTPGKPRKK